MGINLGILTSVLILITIGTGLTFPTSNLWQIGDSLSYDLQGHAGKQRNYHTYNTCGSQFRHDSFVCVHANEL